MPQPAYGPKSSDVMYLSISAAVRVDAETFVAIQKPEQESHEHVRLQIGYD